MAEYNTENLTNLGHLRMLAERVADAVQADENVIEAVKVNGAELAVTDKAVDITVPTDADIQTIAEAAVAASGHASFEVADEVPDADGAEENKLYLVKNADTGYYDIYALVGEEVVLLDDTSVDLSGYSTTEEMNAAIQAAVDAIDLSGYVTTESLETTLADYSTTEEMNTAIDSKAENYSTTEEMNAAISEAISAAVEIASDDDVTAMLDEVYGASDD